MSTVSLELPGHGKYEQPTGLFIGGEWVHAKKGGKFDVINPSNEKVICQVEEGTEEDVDIAVKAARKALNGPWKSMATADRGKCLLKLADLFDENTELLARIESLDNGKSVTMAKGDIAASSGCLRYYGGWADKIHGKVITTQEGVFSYTKREPVGVCGQIIPWNFPILMLAWKLGPALACGNTVVLKSAEQTPLGALVCANLVKQAGFPPGTVNIISGFGKTAGAAISSHMDVDKVAFTGSTLVGRTVMKAAAASNLKKVTLELGGKSPNIIMADANIDDAISWINFGIFYNHGQCCCAGSRVYVHESIYDKVLERFKKRAQENVVGDPFNENTFQGPQVSQLQYDRIMDHIESGKKEGAKIEIGGGRHGDKGYFIQPTIFSGVTPDMRIMKEEIFGPVVVLGKFKDMEEILEMSNNTTYGLAAAVHTQDLNTAIKMADGLKAGTVWINSYNLLHWSLPFGGFKESGIGRELGKYALDNYCQVKTVSINMQGALFG